MTRLEPMPAEAFAGFVEELLAGYANDNVIAGRWSDASALEHASTELAHLLPQGQQTPLNLFYQIWVNGVAGPVGSIWFAELETRSDRVGYLYNIRVHPDYRGRGYARAALQQLEALASGMGLTKLGLHVFSFNLGAHALYRSLGYGVTGMNMLKPLPPR